MNLIKIRLQIADWKMQNVESTFSHYLLEENFHKDNNI